MWFFSVEEKLIGMKVSLGKFLASLSLSTIYLFFFAFQPMLGQNKNPIFNEGFFLLLLAILKESRTHILHYSNFKLWFVNEVFSQCTRVQISRAHTLSQCLLSKRERSETETETETETGNKTPVPSASLSLCVGRMMHKLAKTPYVRPNWVVSSGNLLYICEEQTCISIQLLLS